MRENHFEACLSLCFFNPCRIFRQPTKRMYFNFYILRFTDYGLRFTYYGLRFTSYGLRLTQQFTFPHHSAKIRAMDLFSKEPDLLSLSYQEVEKIALTCTKCRLAKERTKVVFGNGPVPCDLMLIGEAPGAEEDLQGLPFVGRAGQLLTQILGSVGIKRPDDIYIANTVKCRPPENRAPQADEQAACAPYLEAQIKFVKPKIILLAGAPAVKAILKSDQPMTGLRGKWTKLPGTEIAVMPIFHPAYLLRNPSKEKGKPKWLTWEDMKEVKNALEYHRKVAELAKEAED